MKYGVCIVSLTRFGKELFKLYGANKLISIIGNAKNIYQPFGISLPLTGRETGYELVTGCIVLFLFTVDTDMRKNIPLVLQYYESGKV